MAQDYGMADVEQLSTKSLKQLREQIDTELDARHRENADDPEDVIETYLNGAMESLRGKAKMGKKADLGPAAEVHNGIAVSVCYKGDTSRKNSVSRWVKINDDWVWDSDRVVAEKTDYPDFDDGYNGKISVFALDLYAGDEVEIHRKKSHGSGSKVRTLHDFDGAEFQPV